MRVCVGVGNQEGRLKVDGKQEGGVGNLGENADWKPSVLCGGGDGGRGVVLHPADRQMQQT